ncbi:MAG: CFI-box-CTERM domain-containing protein [Planctomycetaceae bacterium]
MANQDSGQVSTTSTPDSNSGGSGGGGGCFIATAAYGSPLDPRVLLLRAFRDEYLGSNRMGRSLIDWYSRVSPPLADKIRESPFLGRLVGGMLWPFVGVVWLIFHPGAGLCLLLGGGFVLMRRRVRKKEAKE